MASIQHQKGPFALKVRNPIRVIGETIRNTKDNAYLYRFLFRYIRPYWWRALIAVSITMPIGMLDGAIAFSLKPYIDGMQAKQSLFNVGFVPLIIVGFTLVQGMLNYTSIYLNGWLGFRIMSDLRRDLFAKLQTMDVQYFHQTTSGNIIQQYFRDPEALQANVLNNTKDMLTRLFSSLFLMGVLVTISWQLSIIAISVLLFVLYPSTRIRKRIKEMTHASNAAASDILSFYNETVGGIQVIYGYNLPPRRSGLFERSQRAMFDQAMRCIKAQGWLTPSMHTISSIGIAIIIWQGSAMVTSGEMTTGSFVSFIAAMLMLYNPIKNLGNSIINAQMSMFAAERIYNLLGLQPSITDRPGAQAFPGLNQEIRFENVHFGYNAEKTVLEDFNLTVAKGETVALVGSSGCGKTTITSLMMRFYDVTGGRITIDGMDLRDIRLSDLRQNIAQVMQDNFLFDGTIRDNMKVGRPDATDPDIWQALDQAYLASFVQDLPQQLDTRIGERGVMLSGGQRQRLAIARALLKDAPIVILDEATSALDNQSEAIVQQAMESLMKERTVLVIAHRLSTIRNADRILVLDQGRILEEGTHADLLTRNNAYANLYSLQEPARTV